MRKNLLICFGLLAILIISGAIAVLSLQDKDDRPLNISDDANTSEVKLPDNQKESVVTNIVNESGIGELPMPVFREDVIVYFKEVPVSLEDFASKYGGKLIFIKNDIKMAAFETNSIGKSGETSQKTLDFINEISKDSRVEKAYKDGFMFIRPDKAYLPQPEIIYPEDYDKEGVKYGSNRVIVGFWRLPPSLEEFGYGATLRSVDDILLFAVFETDNITEFIRHVSTNPYVRYAHPDSIGSII